METRTKTQCIKAFLEAFAPKDLADLYNHDMEVQCTVSQDGGERVSGDFKGKQWNGYSNGIQTWKPIRIPLNGNTNPEFTDSPMTYDLKDHAQGIGMTGWDWKNRKSKWVAFDFDSITGHSEKHAKKLTDLQLEEIKNKVYNIPWVMIRKSTGGKGLHFYIFLEEITTNTRNEHAAVARAILSQLSGIAGFDFSLKVDTQGGNMWVWHRKLASTNGQGLSIIKSNTDLAKIPQNWRDYLNVVTGRRVRNLPKYIEDQKDTNSDIENLFSQLTGQRLRLPLDDDHKKVFDWLYSNYPNAVWWDADHHMMVTHTILLKECHEALSLKGPFETIATGEEKGFDINCFAYPIPKGAWVIRRYTLGVQEHRFWDQDGSGWTRTFFNRAPDFSSACRLYEGIEEPTGGYWFNNAECAQRAACLLGADLALPTWILGKKARLKPHKSGRLTAEIDKDPDSQPLPGWLVAKSKFVRMFNINTSSPGEPEVINLDPQIRHLITESQEDHGWVIKTDTDWHQEPFMHVKEYIRSLGFNPKDVSNILGNSISQCWTLVNMPFREEYPADRRWNRYAVQLRYKPKVERDNLCYPTWTKVLNHCGSGLDDAIKQHGWCKANNIITGADYLKCWIASMFQHPMEPLPYLFFYGPQNSGKSIFHEAISLLLTKGICRADTALSSQSGFNGELENSLLCIVEETDLRKQLVAYNRIKDWVTSIMLPIHKKQKQPYLVRNMTKWIQTANTHLACPVFQGDSRITMTYVKDIRPEDLIPKKLIMPLLEQEAADFIAEILYLELPPSNDRLNVPVVATEDKYAAELANQTMLELYITEKCFYAPGYTVTFAEFYEKFIEWIDPNLASQWTKIRVGREMPPKYPKGRLTSSSSVFFGNISFNKIEESEYKSKLTHINGVLLPTME